MSVSPNDVLRVVVKMDLLSQDIVNVYHLRHYGASVQTDALVMTNVSNALDYLYGLLNARITNQLTYQHITFHNLTQDYFMGQNAFPVLTNGAEATSQPMPLQVAALARFVTNIPGSQGRKFIGGYTEVAVGDGGLVTGLMLADMLNFATGILPGVTVGSDQFYWGNWSPTLNRFAAWTSAVVNAYVCTQRRRRVGVGT